MVLMDRENHMQNAEPIRPDLLPEYLDTETCFSGEIFKKTSIFIGIIDNKTTTYTTYSGVCNIDQELIKKTPTTQT